MNYSVLLGFVTLTPFFSTQTNFDPVISGLIHSDKKLK